MASTDGPATEYKPQGEGPHSTLAGNTLDPNVNPSDSSVHQEGIEHIKANSDAGPGTSSSVPSITAAQPPASNPGADDSTAGIASGAGGTSSAANVVSPVSGTDSQTSGGIIGTVKSYLGYGTTGQEKEAGDSTTEDTSATGDALSSGAGETSATAGAGAAAAGGAAASAADAEPSTTAKSVNKGLGTDPADQVSSGAKPTDSDVTTGGEPTESADPTTRNAATTGGEQAEEERESSGQEYKPDQGKSEAATGHLRENKESIPTAGGKKLGEEHWGESKIVPDNPKAQEEKANVSSAEGQPTDQIRDNTTANTGGAKPPGQDSSAAGDSQDKEKEKLVDKIKNKLHIGSKDKS